MRHPLGYIFLAVFSVLFSVWGAYLSSTPPQVYAETAEELRAKISASQKQLEDIEKEIKKFEAQLNTVGAEKKTLQRAINELDISRKKIQAEVRATEQKISSTDLEIEELNREITVKKLEIERNKDAIAESVRIMNETEDTTTIEMVLGYQSMSEVWNVLAEQASIQASLQGAVRALDALKQEHEKAKDRSITKRDQLDSLKTDLSGQKSSLDSTRDEKDKLLDQTKNKESNYQKLLADKKAAREQFEKELAQYESQLKFILDPSSIPVAGSGVLHWPFEPSYFAECPSFQSALGNPHCLTQYFGDTAFAQSGAYQGKGHNGIDFRAPVGTKVVAALGGTVVATGNTDAIKGCYSYGKWVLVKHGNGLTTLYSHLSSISVSPGQSVATRQLIGYSGNTGYTTGPHLHFTVYASEGVSVRKLGEFTGRTTGCSAAPMPVAAYSAYLNPMSYL